MLCRTLGVFVCALVLAAPILANDTVVRDQIKKQLTDMANGQPVHTIRAPDLIYDMTLRESHRAQVAASVQVGGSNRGVHGQASLSWGDLKSIVNQILNKKVVHNGFLMDGIRPVEQTAQFKRGGKQILALRDVWSGKVFVKKGYEGGAALYAQAADEYRATLRNEGYIAVGYAIVNKHARTVNAWCCVKTRPDLKTLIVAWYERDGRQIIAAESTANHPSDPGVVGVCGTDNSYTVLTLSEESPVDNGVLRVTCLGAVDVVSTPTELKVDYL